MLIKIKLEKEDEIRILKEDSDMQLLKLKNELSDSQLLIKTLEENNINMERDQKDHEIEQSEMINKFVQMKKHIQTNLEMYQKPGDLNIKGGDLAKMEIEHTKTQLLHKSSENNNLKQQLEKCLSCYEGELKAIKQHCLKMDKHFKSCLEGFNFKGKDMEKLKEELKHTTLEKVKLAEDLKQMKIVALNMKQKI